MSNTEINCNEAGALLMAVEFAAEKHRNQRRKEVDASPYVNHPIRVASMIANIGGVNDICVLMAAILHDTVEDTCTPPEELERIFGAEVKRIVMEVTDDKSLPKDERKKLQIEHSPHISAPAKTVKLADKCANIIDVSENPPSDWSMERRSDYLAWAEKVVEGCRGINAALEAHFDTLLVKARIKLGLQ